MCIRDRFIAGSIEIVILKGKVIGGTINGATLAHPVYCRLFIKCFIHSADVSVIVISSEKFAQTAKTGCNVTAFDALQLRVCCTASLASLSSIRLSSSRLCVCNGCRPIVAKLGLTVRACGKKFFALIRARCTNIVQL